MDFLGYRKLVVYTKAQELVKSVYKSLERFPREEQFALCSQLRRAAVSITSNIAEGVSRYSYKDKVHFLEIAFGSLMEVMSQLELAKELEYITEKELHEIELLAVNIAQLLTSLQYSFLPTDEEGEITKPYQRKK
jgi:four helix bundle protein